MTAGPRAESLSIFLPDFESMSEEELLAYITRVRRQLDRMSSLPAGTGIDPAEEAAIRQMCDELEISIRSHD